MERTYNPEDFRQLVDFYSKGISSKVVVSNSAQTYSVNLLSASVTIPAIDVKAKDETMLIFGVRHETEHLKHSRGFLSWMAEPSRNPLELDILNCLDDPRIDLEGNREYENGKYFSDYAYQKYAPDPVSKPSISQWIYGLKYAAYFGVDFKLGFSYSKAISDILKAIHTKSISELSVPVMLSYVAIVYSELVSQMEKQKHEYCECCGKQKPSNSLSWVCSDCNSDSGSSGDSSDSGNSEDSSDSGNSKSDNSEDSSEDNSESGNSKSDSSEDNSEDSSDSGSSEANSDSDNSDDSSESGNSEDSSESGNSESGNSESGNSEDSSDSGNSNGLAGGNSEDSSESDSSEVKPSELDISSNPKDTWKELAEASTEIAKKLAEASGVTSENIIPDPEAELIKPEAKEKMINLINRLDAGLTEGEIELNSNLIDLHSGVTDNDIELVFSESYTPSYETPESTIVLLLDISSSMEGYWGVHPYSGDYISKQTLLMELVSEIAEAVSLVSTVNLDCFIFGRYSVKYPLPDKPSLSKLRGFIRKQRIGTGATYFSGIPALIDAEAYNPKTTLFLLVTDGGFSGYSDNSKLTELGEKYAVTGLFLGRHYDNDGDRKRLFDYLHELAKEHLITDANIAEASEIFVAALEHAEAKLEELA